MGELGGEFVSAEARIGAQLRAVGFGVNPIASRGGAPPRRLYQHLVRVELNK